MSAADHERPTIPVWAVAIIRDLEAQLDRLYSGRGCRACSASGHEIRSGPAGTYERACAACDGSGTVDLHGRPYQDPHSLTNTPQ